MDVIALEVSVEGMLEDEVVKRARIMRRLRGMGVG